MSSNRLLFAAVLCSCCLLVPCVSSQDDDIQEPVEKAADHIPTFISEPKFISVEEGATVTFECFVDKLDPYVIMWNKGGSPMFIDKIKASSDVRVDLDPNDRMRMTVKDVTIADEGEYTCEIGRFQEKPLKLTHHLHVESGTQKQPHIHAKPPPGDVTVSEGDDVSLICKAEGRPSPTITWKTEESDVQKGNILNGGTTLMFKRVVETDAGQYECIASNGVGNEARVVYRLRVAYAPKITIEKRLFATAGLPSIELVCIVKADPPVKEISWLRGLPEVSPSERVQVYTSGNARRVKISTPREGDFGNYTCVASNDVNVVRETVNVNGLPDQVIVKSRQQGFENNSYVLNFTTQSVAPIIDVKLFIREAYKDNVTVWQNVTIPGNDIPPIRYSDSYDIKGLTPGTAYEIVLKARNSFGLSHPNEQFIFATKGGDLEKLVQPSSSTTGPSDKSSEMKSGLVNDSKAPVANANNASAGKTSLSLLIVAGALLLVALN